MKDIAEFIKLSRDERRAHLNLLSGCCERGGNSTNHKGVLAQYLNTTIPSGRILLCHACNNEKCSNPTHLYWGTDYDNLIIDGTLFDTHKSPWERLVEKYGYDEACNLNRHLGNTNGAGNKNKPKSEEHKRKISENHKGGRKKNASVAKLVDATDFYGTSE